MSSMRIITREMEYGTRVYLKGFYVDRGWIDWYMDVVHVQSSVCAAYDAIDALYPNLRYRLREVDANTFDLESDGSMVHRSIVWISGDRPHVIMYSSDNPDVGLHLADICETYVLERLMAGAFGRIERDTAIGVDLIVSDGNARLTGAAII